MMEAICFHDQRRFGHMICHVTRVTRRVDRENRGSREISCAQNDQKLPRQICPKKKDFIRNQLQDLPKKSQRRLWIDLLRLRRNFSFKVSQSLVFRLEIAQRLQLCFRLSLLLGKEIPRDKTVDY
jgi:hypothetical protein